MSDRQISHPCPVRAVTRGPKHHFFGYFDKLAWDPAGTTLLTLETEFLDRMPTAEDRVRVCTIDLEDNDRLEVVAESRAWCWQQANMLQWLPGEGRRILFNDREGTDFVARILDLDAGTERTLPRPVYCVSPDARWGLSVSFSRLARYRPGYGYEGGTDPHLETNQPDAEGVWRVDLETGESRLILSHAELLRRFPWPEAGDAPVWFNHLLVNPDGTRFSFMQRFSPRSRLSTRFYTADPDGENVYPLNPHEMTSHYAWMDPGRIIAFANQPDSGWGYYIFTDGHPLGEPVGRGQFPEGDGHCSAGPENDWMLTDCYANPETDWKRRLVLYHFASRTRVDIGEFDVIRDLPRPARCDLHPLWSRDGRSVCIDSLHEGHRQVYLVEIGEVLDRYG